MVRSGTSFSWPGLELSRDHRIDRQPDLFDAVYGSMVRVRKKGRKRIPISFWYWSIGGSVIMFLYFLFRRDPVGVIAYLPNSVIYIRNLMLIRKRKLAYTAASSSQNPRETE